MDFIPLRIRLPFGSEDEFIARYGVHVGRDGFFLATRSPKAEGTPLAFELVLSDGSALLSGEGVVARTVSGTRSGMVVRFLRLHGAGAALVERIVAARPGPQATAPSGPTTPAAPEPPTWPGDPTRDVARVAAPVGGPRASLPAPPPAPTPAQELDDHPSSDLAVPLDEASTWPGDPTRDLVRSAAAEVRVVPVHRPAAPVVPADRAAPVPPPAPAAPVAQVPAPAPAVPVVPAARAAPVPPPALVAPAAPVAPVPPPAEALPEAEPELPFHLRPTPALGIPQSPVVKAAHVHTAVTPVRGIPALGPDVVAFLATGAPGRPPPEPVTQRTGSGQSPVPTSGSAALEASGLAAETPVLEAAPAAADDLTRLPEPKHDLSRLPDLPLTRTAIAAPVAPEPAAELPAPPPRSPLATEPHGEPATPTTTPAAAASLPMAAAAPPGVAIPLPAPSTAQAVTPRATPPPPAPPPATPPASAMTPPEAAAPPVEARTDTAPLPGPPAVKTVRAATPEAGLPSAVLGLDVGTSSARVAWVHDGRAELLPPDGDGGADALPCRLVRDGHGVLRMQHPGEADEPLWVGSPVTLLGVHADSPAIRTLARRWPVPVVADERGEVAFDWSGVTVTAVELVATLLRSLRASAERRTSRSCTQAVLVVPAAFTLLQRARLREAAERAGLIVLRLLNAPTAAALAFAHDQGIARRRMLVWRMGAATCDAAVVAVSGNDLDVVSAGGDGALGGVNFDEQLALALDKTARSEPARLRQRVAQAERCKQTLSSNERGLVPPVTEGEPVIEVTRADLELRTAALVERSVLLAQDVLRAAGLSPENIDDLLLCGGMAQVPHVRRAVEAAFGKTAAPGTDALGAAAVGAALLGATLSAPAPGGRSASSVVEVLAVALEAVAPEFGHHRAFERNTRLPAEKTLTLTLPEGQPLEVQLFQGIARAPDPRSFLGLLHAAGVERAGEWALHLALSADGLFQAAVTPPAGKRRTVGLQAAPPPTEAETAAEAHAEAADPGTRLLGGLKRLFGRR